MPNIRKQIVGDLSDLGGAFVGVVGLHITVSNGNTWTITKADIVAIFQAQTGTLAARKAATIAAIKSQAQAALGAAMLDTTAVTVDVNTATGDPVTLAVT